MAGSQSNGKVSRPKWTQVMDSKNCRMRMSDVVSDVLGPLPDVRLWFHDKGIRMPLGVDNTSLFFNAEGWKKCVDQFGFRKGMLLQFKTAPRRGPEDFHITIKQKEKVRSVSTSAVKSKTTKSYVRNKLREVKSPVIGRGFYVRMTKSYVYRSNATVTIPARFGWWNYFGGVKTNRVTLTFNEHRHDHVVSVHCYEDGSSTKIARGWNRVVRCCGIRRGDMVFFTLDSAMPICFKVHVCSAW